MNISTAQGKEKTLPPIEQQHSRTTRWMHWINFPLLAIMIWSGLRIYWADRREFFTFVPDWANEALLTITKRSSWALRKIGLDFLPNWLRETSFKPDETLDQFTNFFDVAFAVLQLDKKLANGMAWHFNVGWFFAANGLFFTIYLLRSGRWKELTPGKGALKNSIIVTLHDLKIWRKPLPPQDKYNAAQQLAYTGVILLGALALLTGFAIYKPTQLSFLTALFGGYEFAKDIHLGTTIAFIAFFIIHILQVAKAGWNNFMAMVTGYDRKQATAQLANSSSEIQERFAFQTRRSALTGIVGVIGGFITWTAVRSSPQGQSRPQVLDNGHRINQAIWSTLHRAKKLAPTFARSLSSKPRVNGRLGIRTPLETDTWNMQILGETNQVLGTETLERIRSLPKQEHTVEHKCVEGWSHIVTWGGVPFSVWAEPYLEQFNELPKYVNLETPDNQYYVSLDIESMLHPQTMLTYELEGQPLEAAHGAPVRLTTPLKYGIKQIKRIGKIQFSNTRGADYWNERGYDWYSHL